MDASQQSTTEFRITAVCTVTDPAERQRRLAQVFGLIMSLGRQRRAAAETKPDAVAQTAS
jgi:hypothetical protein